MNVDAFCAVTGASEGVARFFLTGANNNVELAVTNYFDNPAVEEPQQVRIARWWVGGWVGLVLVWLVWLVWLVGGGVVVQWWAGLRGLVWFVPYVGKLKKSVHSARASTYPAIPAATASRCGQGW
jgi:hypothetical protein